MSFANDVSSPFHFGRKNSCIRMKLNIHGWHRNLCVGIISSRLRKILPKGFYIRIIEFQVFKDNISLVIFAYGYINGR